MPVEGFTHETGTRMKNNRTCFFRPLPLLSPGKALLLRALMLPNFLLTKACGLDNLCRQEGAQIYAFNHNNSLEAILVPVFLMYHLGGKTISFVIDWMYGKIPLLGQLMDLVEPVYVFNKRSKLPWIENERPASPPDDVIGRCSEKLFSGRSIGIFPEGKRNRNPACLMKGKPGIAHIALRTGAAVVPVGIDFNCRMSKNRIPVLGRTIIRIGRPLHFRKESGEYREILSRQEKSADSRRQLNRLADEVTHEIMLSLSGLSGKQYSEPCPALKYNPQPQINLEEQPCPV